MQGYTNPSLFVLDGQGARDPTQNCSKSRTGGCWFQILISKSVGSAWGQSILLTAKQDMVLNEFIKVHQKIINCV